MMNVGTEWMVDALDCSPQRLREVRTLEAICKQIINDLDLRVVGQPLWHQFPDPGGVTGLYLLTESHLACHTYPETGIATFNLYCCKARPEWSWSAQLRARLGATQVTVRYAERGADAEELETRGQGDTETRGQGDTEKGRQGA
ncbi:MAG: S-adenosylmethionine decarboxylase [Acidobacteria bacterium]|nr:S-adenosylmethionine decarboxylase [Acidobacteriota bacterium]